MDDTTALVIATGLAFLAGFATLVWIFYDSQRHSLAATAYKTAATALAVLTLPGLFLAVNRVWAWPVSVWTRDPNSSYWLTVLSMLAGALSLVTLILYALRVGLKDEMAAGGASEAAWNPTWDAARATDMPDDTGHPTDVMMPAEPEMAAPVAPTVGVAAAAEGEAQRTKVLHPKPKYFAWLVLLNGPQQGRELSLDDDLVIGRDGTTSQIVLEDRAVSEMHARIRHVDGQFILHDLGSTNGTFIGGEEITKQVLKDKDILRLGETDLVFIWVSDTITNKSEE